MDELMAHEEIFRRVETDNLTCADFWTLVLGLEKY
jgi:hypothetical protein